MRQLRQIPEHALHPVRVLLAEGRRAPQRLRPAAEIVTRARVNKLAIPGFAVLMPAAILTVLASIWLPIPVWVESSLFVAALACAVTYTVTGPLASADPA